MRFIRLVGLPLVFALAACSRGSRDDTPLDPLPGDRPATPRLVFEQEWAPPLDVYPTPFGLGPGPTFLVRARQGYDRALALVGPNRDPFWLSRAGDGPGEVRDAMVLALAGDTVDVFDAANQRLVRWDITGHLLGQFRVDGMPNMSVPAPDGDWLGARIDEVRPMPIRVSGRDGSSRALISSADSFRVAEFGTDRGRAQLGSVGRWPGGFLLANGKTYRIGGYDWQGRLRFVIAPDVGVNHYGPRGLERELASLGAARGRSAATARLRDRLASEPLQWFSHLAPPRVDAKGRIWIVGRMGDSNFADAWWRDESLGRTMLDCLDSWGRWNLAGDRIALACAPPADDTVHDWVYRIWRIEDAPPPQGP